MPDTDSANDSEQDRSAAAAEMTSRAPAPPPPLVAWQMPAPSSVAAADQPGTPIRLWRPVHVAVVSFLIGFPAGLGLAARNAWRLGRRRRAWVRIKGLPSNQWKPKRGLDPGAFEVDHLTAGTFTKATVGGKAGLRGTLAIIEQTIHAHGIPYIYSTEDVQFVVVTDDPGWAADAIRQLP